MVSGRPKSLSRIGAMVQVASLGALLGVPEEALERRKSPVSSAPRREHMGFGVGKYLPHQSERELARRRLQPEYGGNWRKAWGVGARMWP